MGGKRGTNDLLKLYSGTFINLDLYTSLELLELIKFSIQRINGR